jgi:arylsulfatase A-like enzyme
MYLATTNIHHPFTPAKQFIGTSECGLYGDFIHELDWIVGGVLDALREMEVADNTIVIFTSDNGGMLHVTGQKAWKAGHHMNGDLLGFKFGAWEGGHRVPMVVRWPGRIPADTTSGHLISHIDWLATLASIVGRPLKEGEAVDSLDQLKVLAGSPEAPVRKTLIVTPNSPKHLSVRHGKWVYIPERDSGGFQGKKVGSHLFAGAAALPFAGRANSDVVNGKIRKDAPPAQLYDLESDPHQEQNVYGKHPEVVRELEVLLNDYRRKIPRTKRLGWINLRQ